MKELVRIAFDLQTFCLEQGWRFCFIGGLALQRWGEPRLTRDIDVTLLTGLGTELPFIESLLARYAARMPNASQFALVNRVLLLKTPSGVGIDIAMAGMPFEEAVVERASDHSYGKGLRLHTCSAEDLVLLKAFADRPQDWVDIEGIVLRQRAALDREFITQNLEPLCELKEAPEIMDKLRGLFERFPPAAATF